MEQCLNSSEKDILHSQVKYSTILAYYKKMALPKANDYEKKYSIIVDKSNKWLEKNGQEIKLDLQIDKFIEQIKSIEHKGMRILHYTHERDKRGMVSFYEAAKITSQTNRPIMLDLCSSTQPKTKTYDIWLQECYSLLEILHLNVLSNVLFNQNAKDELFTGIQIFFDNSTKDFSENKKLKKMFNEILTKQDKCIKNFKNKSYIKEFCKSTVNFIETLLREIYYEMHKSEKYVDKESLTLGILLNTEKKMLSPKFNNDFLNGLRYYLSHDTNDKGEKVGLDLRNKMNHADVMLDSEYDQTLFIRISLILLTLINEFYITTL